MSRFFAALAAAVLLVGVGLSVSRREIRPPSPVSIVAPVTSSSTSTTVDWAPYARAVARAELLDAQRRFLAAIAANEAHKARPGAQHARSVPGPGPDYTTWPDWSLWRCTMLHESGGSWTFQTRAYAGAFAIARSTWRAFAGVYAREYPNAALAPPAAQILGARLVRARVGSSLWGGLRACRG